MVDAVFVVVIIKFRRISKIYVKIEEVFSNTEKTSAIASAFGNGYSKIKKILVWRTNLKVIWNARKISF